MGCDVIQDHICRDERRWTHVQYCCILYIHSLSASYFLYLHSTETKHGRLACGTVSLATEI